MRGAASGLPEATRDRQRRSGAPPKYPVRSRREILDRVADARVPQLTAVNQAVHGCRTHPQLPSYLGNGEPRHSVGQELTTTRSSLAGARDCGGQVVRDVMGLYWGFAHAKLSQSGRTVVRTALANRPIF